MYIPLQLVETEYLQELEVAIAAAVASSSSCKISSSPSSSTPPCHLPVPSCLHKLSDILSDGTTQNSFGCRSNAHKDEACASFRPLEETIAAHAADEPSSNLKETKAQIVNNNKPWMLASCFYRVKEGKLPHFQFKGRIEYSNMPLDAENAAHKLLRQIEAKKATCGGSVPLGFDAEWKVIDDQAQKVAVLQLCIDSGNCNVFHVIYSGISFPLRNILEDPSVFKVGVGSHADARKIFRAYNVAVNGVKDLNELANLKLKGPGQVNRPWSLSSLAEELFGKQVDKDKSIRMGDWELHNLSEAQLQYAATDAFASLSVFQALLDL